jgi:hypothetical protein
MTRHLTPLPDEMAFARARISRRTPAPVQGGKALESAWLVEFDPTEKPDIDPLMGWVSSCDAQQQVRMGFPDLDSAVAYCEREGIPYDVIPPAPRRKRPRSYADNFESFEGGPKPIYPH